MQEGWATQKNIERVHTRKQRGWRVRNNEGSFEASENYRMLGGLERMQDGRTHENIGTLRCSEEYMKICGLI